MRMWREAPASGESLAKNMSQPDAGANNVSQPDTTATSHQIFVGSFALSGTSGTDNVDGNGTTRQTLAIYQEDSANGILSYINQDALVGAVGDVFNEAPSDVGNNSMANAINVDDPQYWHTGNTLTADPSIPSVMIAAGGFGHADYYNLYIAAGETVTFDVDFASMNYGCPSWDAGLAVFNPSGSQVASSFDSTVTGDVGSGFNVNSTTSSDPYLTYTATTSGYFTVEVGEEYLQRNPNGPVLRAIGAPPAGDQYVLNISKAGHDYRNVAESGIITFGNGLANSAPGYIVGTDQTDYAYANAGSDTVFMGGGDDTVFASQGSDNINGGDGTDTLTFTDPAGHASQVDAAVTITLSTRLGAGIGEAVFGHGTNIFSNFEIIDGSQYSDTITGDSGDNRLNGLVGNDTISGGDGNDRIEGGQGNDMLDGGAGFDVADYELAPSGVTVDLNLTTAQNTVAEGSDTLGNFEELDGSAFGDRLTAAEGGSSLVGNDGNDVLIGRDGADTMSGGAGNDNLSGAAGDDYMYSSAGDDSFFGNTGVDTVDFSLENIGVHVDLRSTAQQNTGDGNDLFSSIEHVIGSSLSDTLIGSDGANETLEGGGGNDTLQGGDGDDTLLGGAGDNTLDGGAGFDIVDYSATYGVTVDLSQGSASNDDSGDTDSLSGIEEAIGSAYDDTLVSGGQQDVLVGGGGGNYYIAGLGGTVIGSEYDELSLENATSGWSFDLGTGMGSNAAGVTLVAANTVFIDGSAYADQLSVGTASVDQSTGIDYLYVGGDGGDDVISMGESGAVIDGGSGNDTVSYADVGEAVTARLGSGDGSAERGTVVDGLYNVENLTGSAYDDNLTGDAGNNFLRGRTGNDNITGGGGTDVLEGDGGYDRAIFADATSGVTVDLSATGYQNIGAWGSVELNGIEAINGSAFADTLTGEAHNNVLSGAGGNDTLVGGGGNDQLNGGSGIDTADYSGAGVGVHVDLSNAAAQNTQVGLDTLSSIENLLGGAYSDVLTGSSVANALMGGSAADKLDGGLGKDTLTGGAGADKFAFTTTLGANNIDTITDFTAGQDRILLDHNIFTGLATGNLAASAFDTGAAASDADDRIIYNSATGALFFDSDGTGSAAQVQFATLSAGLSLGASSFVVT